MFSKPITWYQPWSFQMCQVMKVNAGQSTEGQQNYCSGSGNGRMCFNTSDRPRRGGLVVECPDILTT